MNLTSDALEEVLMRMPTRDIVAVASTCRTLHSFIVYAAKVWIRRFWDEFAFEVPANAQIDHMALMKTFYDAIGYGQIMRQHSLVRFQGVLTSGGIDMGNLSYSFDHLFNATNAPCCTNQSRADIIGLLLDGEVDRDKDWGELKEYVIEKLIGFRALMLFMPILHDYIDENFVKKIREELYEWTDMPLANAFVRCAEDLRQGGVVGRQLLWGISDVVSQQCEQDRIFNHLERVQTFLDELSSSLLSYDSHWIDGGGGGVCHEEIVFDTSVLNKINSPSASKNVAIIKKLVLSREGELTCPVSQGIIYAGTISYSKLQGLPPRDVADRLKASRAQVPHNWCHISTKQQYSFQNLLGKVEGFTCNASGSFVKYRGPVSGKGLSWPVEYTEDDSDAFKGAFCIPDEWRPDGPATVGSEEYQYLKKSVGRGHPKEVDSDIITWRPLVWFKFSDMDEMERYSEIGGEAFVASFEQSPSIESMNFIRRVSNQAVHQDDGAEGVTSGRNRMEIHLSKACVCNALLVQLIEPENLMSLYGDEHEEPNCDMKSIEIVGGLVNLPF